MTTRRIRSLKSSLQLTNENKENLPNLQKAPRRVTQFILQEQSRQIVQELTKCLSRSTPNQREIQELCENLNKFWREGKNVLKVLKQTQMVYIYDWLISNTSFEYCGIITRLILCLVKYSNLCLRRGVISADIWKEVYTSATFCQILNKIRSVQGICSIIMELAHGVNWSKNSQTQVVRRLLESGVFETALSMMKYCLLYRLTVYQPQDWENVIGVLQVCSIVEDGIHLLFSYKSLVMRILSRLLTPCKDLTKGKFIAATVLLDMSAYDPLKELFLQTCQKHKILEIISVQLSETFHSFVKVHKAQKYKELLAGTLLNIANFISEIEDALYLIEKCNLMTAISKSLSVFRKEWAIEGSIYALYNLISLAQYNKPLQRVVLQIRHVLKALPKHLNISLMSCIGEICKNLIVFEICNQAQDQAVPVARAAQLIKNYKYVGSYTGICMNYIQSKRRQKSRKSQKGLGKGKG